jgi:hypothetical protein
MSDITTGLGQLVQEILVPKLNTVKAEQIGATRLRLSQDESAMQAMNRRFDTLTLCGRE